MRVNREMIMLGLNFINPLIRILELGLRIPIYQSILSRIPRQHHSCPNEVVISIVSFNRRFPKLPNDPMVDRIV